MKKLTQILSEISSNTKPTIIGQGSDPWDYALDKASNTWFARKKNSDIWIDLLKKLTPEKYKEAHDILHKRLNGQTGDNKGNIEQRQRVINAPDKNKKSSNFNIKDSITQYKIQVKMLEAFYIMLTKEPKKYFSKYASNINDDEQAAAAAWKKHCDENYMPVLKLQLADKDSIIQRNCESIKYVIDNMYNILINGRHSEFRVELINPADLKKYKMHIIWNYM